MENCPNCGKLVEKLVSLDHGGDSAQYTQLIGVPDTRSDLYCITCLRQVLGISDEDLIREDRLLSKNSDFMINLLKGRVGQVAIEIIFRNFGYEVYPYGYESYLTNVIKHMRKTGSNDIVKQIRSTPDTFIYDREINQAFLLEIKSTTSSLNRFWLEEELLKKYKKLWGEAILIVIHIPSSQIYCKYISEINLKIKKTLTISFSGKKGYLFNLKKEFESLDKIFRLVDTEELILFTKRIKKEVWKKYAH